MFKLIPTVMLALGVGITAAGATPLKVQHGPEPLQMSATPLIASSADAVSVQPVLFSYDYEWVENPFGGGYEWEYQLQAW